MDVPTIFAALTSSLGLSITGAYWLSKNLISHRLTQALEEKKAELASQLERLKGALTEELERKKASLQGELARDKALVEGAVKREVELYLGERAAQRQYEFEARKRLYVAVGPLRFQLLLACRDLAGRIEAHGRRQQYLMDITSYYGRSTLYRLLRPLAVAELIERQIAYSDFAVDQSAVDCLRFKKSVVRILSGDDVVGDHPGVDWNHQAQHVFADSIAFAANALLRETSGASDRVMRFDEFSHTLKQDGLDRFQPFPRLLADFSIAAKPLLWLRLVAYGNACNSFVTRAGEPLGFERLKFSTPEHIRASRDPYLVERQAEYERRVADLALVPL